MSIFRCCRYFFPRRRETILRNFLFLFVICVCFAAISVRFDIANYIQQDGDEKESSYEKHHAAIKRGDDDKKKRSREGMREIYPGDSELKRTGPGEKGGAVSLTEDEKQEADVLMKKWFFNIVASDKIALDRTVPDTRHQE